MKTTLIIPDALYRDIKKRAAVSRRSISDLVAELLQAGMRPAVAKPTELPPLPSFHMGRPRVDVADRDALERAMRPER
ncbi:MAG: hypothetical protein ACRD1M_14500 [Terriglobales bacterium]